MTDDATLPDWVAADVSFEVIYGNNIDKLWHVRGIIDGMAICRRWQSERVIGLFGTPTESTYGGPKRARWRGRKS